MLLPAISIAIDASIVVTVVRISNQKKDHHSRQFFLEPLVKTLAPLKVQIIHMSAKFRVTMDLSYHRIWKSNLSKLCLKVKRQESIIESV